MENELIEVPQHAMVIAREPEKVLAEAKTAAKALMTVVNQKKKPVIINGEQYLEFEDWMTVARFYGLSVKVARTELIDLGAVRGYEATAEVIRGSDGMVISSADAMCLNDEEKWSTRAKYEYIKGIKTKTGEIAVPLFQLRSMAQTRACAKALRNVLAWVVVLGGFKPTPAEEMTDGIRQPVANSKPAVNMPQAKVLVRPVTPPPITAVDLMEEAEAETDLMIPFVTDAANMPQARVTPRPPTKLATPPPPPSPPPIANKAQNPISEAQAKRFYAIYKGSGYTDAEVKEFLRNNFSITSSREIEKEYYDDIISHFQVKKEA